jgi:ADP-heptose:LPS heptosyltransferase
MNDEHKNPQQPHRILVSKLRQIGDAVLWTSALESLRAAFPTAKIEALTPGYGPSLLAHHPAIDTIHVVEGGRLGLLKTFWKLRSQRYDFFLGFHANSSLCRSSFLIRARERILHHHSLPYSPVFNTRVVPFAGQLEHVIFRDHRILEAMGIATTPPAPKLYVTEEEKAKAHALLVQRGLKNLRKIRILLAGARVSTRRYPEDLWKQFAKKLRQSEPQQPLLVVADPDQARNWNLDSFCAEEGLTLLADLSLRDLLAVIACCDTAIGNDSGLIHAAAALGLKTLSLFGAGCFEDFKPAAVPGSNQAINRSLRVHVDCRLQGPRDRETFQYCTLLECSHHTCMRSITPQAILDETLSLQGDGTYLPPKPGNGP